MEPRRPRRNLHGQALYGRRDPSLWTSLSVEPTPPASPAVHASPLRTQTATSAAPPLVSGNSNIVDFHAENLGGAGTRPLKPPEDCGGLDAWVSRPPDILDPAWADESTTDAPMPRSVSRLVSAELLMEPSPSLRNIKLPEVDPGQGDTFTAHPRLPRSVSKSEPPSLQGAGMLALAPQQHIPKPSNFPEDHYADVGALSTHSELNNAQLCRFAQDPAEWLPQPQLQQQTHPPPPQKKWEDTPVEWPPLPLPQLQQHQQQQTHPSPTPPMAFASQSAQAPVELPPLPLHKQQQQQQSEKVHQKLNALAQAHKHRIVKEILHTWLGIVQSLNDFLQIVRPNSSNIGNILAPNPTAAVISQSDGNVVSADAVGADVLSACGSPSADLNSFPELPAPALPQASSAANEVQFSSTQMTTECCSSDPDFPVPDLPCSIPEASSVTRLQLRQARSELRSYAIVMLKRLAKVQDDAQMRAVWVAWMSSSNQVRLQSQVTSLTHSNEQMQEEIKKASLDSERTRSFGVVVGCWMAKCFEGTSNRLLKRSFYVFWVFWLEAQKVQTQITPCLRDKLYTLSDTLLLQATFYIWKLARKTAARRKELKAALNSWRSPLAWSIFNVWASLQPSSKLQQSVELSLHLTKLCQTLEVRLVETRALFALQVQIASDEQNIHFVFAFWRNFVSARKAQLQLQALREVDHCKDLANRTKGKACSALQNFVCVLNETLLKTILWLWAGIVRNHRCQQTAKLEIQNVEKANQVRLRDQNLEVASRSFRTESGLLLEVIFLQWHNARSLAIMERKNANYLHRVLDADKEAMRRVREQNLEAAGRFVRAQGKFLLEGVIMQWRSNSSLAIMQRRVEYSLHCQNDADRKAMQHIQQQKLEMTGERMRLESKFLLECAFAQWQISIPVGRMQQRIEDCLRCVDYASKNAQRCARVAASTMAASHSACLKEFTLRYWSSQCEKAIQARHLKEKCWGKVCECNNMLSALQNEVFYGYIIRHWRDVCERAKANHQRQNIFVAATLRTSQSLGGALLAQAFGSWKNICAQDKSAKETIQWLQRRSQLVDKALMSMQDQASLHTVLMSWKEFHMSHCKSQEADRLKEAMEACAAESAARTDCVTGMMILKIAKLQVINADTLLQVVFLLWKEVWTEIVQENTVLRIMQKALVVFSKNDAIAQQCVFNSWKDVYFHAFRDRCEKQAKREMREQAKNNAMSTTSNLVHGQDEVLLQVILVSWRSICVSSLHAQEVEQLKYAADDARAAARQSAQSAALKMLLSQDSVFLETIFKLWKDVPLQAFHQSQISKLQQHIQSMTTNLKSSTQSAMRRLFVSMDVSLLGDVFASWKSEMSRALQEQKVSKLVAELRGIKGQSRGVPVSACLKFLCEHDGLFLQVVLAVWKGASQQEAMARKEKCWEEKYLASRYQLVLTETKLQEQLVLFARLEDSVAPLRFGHSNLEKFCNEQRLHVKSRTLKFAGSFATSMQMSWNLFLIKCAFDCWKTIHSEVVLYRVRSEALQQIREKRGQRQMALEHVLWTVQHGALINDAFLVWKEFFFLSKVSLEPELQKVQCSVLLALRQLRSILLIRVVFHLWCLQILRFYQQVADIHGHQDFLALPCFKMWRVVCTGTRKATPESASAVECTFNNRLAILGRATNHLSQKIRLMEPGPSQFCKVKIVEGPAAEAGLMTLEPEAEQALEADEDAYMVEVVDESKQNLSRGASARSWRSLLHAESPKPWIWEDPEVGTAGPGSVARTRAVSPSKYEKSFRQRGASCDASKRRILKGRPELTAASAAAAVASTTTDDHRSPMVPKKPLSPFVRKPFLASGPGPARKIKGYSNSINTKVD